MQTTRTRPNQVLAGAPLDDRDVDSCQGQLTRQHQACRASSDNNHRTVGFRFGTHFATPQFTEFWLRPAIFRHDTGLAASPRVRYTLRVGRSRYAPFLFRLRWADNLGAKWKSP